MSEHAVIVNFQYDSTDLSALFDLEEKLETIIEKAGVGELDGNEVAIKGSDSRLYMYGPDADALYDAIKETLSQTSFMNDANILKRYGPPEEGIREVTISIHA